MNKKIISFTTSSAQGVLILQMLSTSFLVYALFQNFNVHYWLLSLVVYFCTGCLGITITFHRYISHKSFILSRPLECVFSLFGSLGGTGSPLGWVALHRDHHDYSDTPNDPHSPSNGLLKVFFSQYKFKFNKWTVRDLLTDRFHQILHFYYHALILLWALFWLSLSFNLFVFIVAIPMAIQIWVSTASNILNHKSGYRNFDTTERSTNNFIIALLSWGEGWHNNHHRFPSRWCFQIKWWELDISSYVIYLIKKTSR